MEPALAYRNCIHKDAKSLVPFTFRPLLSCLISTNINIKNILSVVLYGCEAWSLILREECRLRTFENRVQRNIWT
jgi:hypothetical protein